jgi:predicted Fe-Mo cluster-binding NifX family protein
MEPFGICHHLGRVSPVFDVAKNLLIFRIENGRPKPYEERRLTSTNFDSRAKEVSGYGVKTVICGAVSRPQEMALRRAGIDAISLICGPVHEVALAFTEGRLDDSEFLMPGCWRGAGRFGVWRGHRRIENRFPEGGPMKIAVTSVDGTMEGRVDERFGRCRKLVIYDPAKDTMQALDNDTNMGAAQGAGIQTAQNVVNARVAAVISGHFGPKAFQVLRTAGVDLYSAVNMTVSEALSLFKEGKLLKLAGADVASHW